MGAPGPRKNHAQDLSAKATAEHRAPHLALLVPSSTLTLQPLLSLIVTVLIQFRVGVCAG